MAKEYYFKIPNLVTLETYNQSTQQPASWNFITAEDLGTGAVGAGLKYLADDLTWKTISSSPTGIDEIQLELRMTSALNRFKEITYDVNGNITNMEIWDSSAKATQYFNVDYNYTGDNLTNIETTRISDSFVFNKNLTYDGSNNLIEIEII